ncbi:MAG: RnfH family protein [Gammaproteobacteria bacterium]|jgi:putative ubiquitin-RnfH superfamily antitoxin RatB of RatAB toxin-antitoxin module
MVEDDALLGVDVVFARADVQEIIKVRVPRGATIRATIERSRILDTYPEIDLAVNRVGIFGSLRALGDTVQDGDRIEIYRPLLVDPKEARRRKAAAARDR